LQRLLTQLHPAAHHVISTDKVLDQRALRAHVLTGVCACIYGLTFGNTVSR
jgi:hypothetical protein